MNKAFEDILKKLRTVAVERQGNTGMGGELVVNLDDAQDIVQEAAEEYNNGGWIPCSGCKECHHKECEHYGEV